MPKAVNNAARKDDPNLTLPHLLARVVFRMESAANQTAKPYALRVHGIRALIALANKGQATVSELAEIASMDLATFSQLLKRLEASGYIVKQRLAGDSRVVTVTLTAKGKVVADVWQPLAVFIESRLMHGIDGTERLILRAALVKIYENTATLDNDIAAFEKQLRSKPRKRSAARTAIRR